MSHEVLARKLQCRGAESGQAPVPLDSSAERDFLRERLALFARTSFLATFGFFVAGFVIEGLWSPRIGAPASFSRPDILFHLAACSVLLATWMAARQPGLSEGALRAADAVGTVGNLGLFACMAVSMPRAWRPEMLYLLIAISVLLYRAATVPSPPWRTGWISTLAAAPAPILASILYARGAPAEVSRGMSVAYALLWGLLGVFLATLVSFVTFRLRKSVARARRLGQYTLGEKLGEGGMGIVYRAEHEMLRRPTAIKLLPPGRAGEESLKRFEREVQQTARLTSPHTVSIYDFGRTPDGLFYYVMEYLDGLDLEDLVKGSGPLAPGRAVRILRQVCAALAEAHGIGLIHRDIKPSNILLCERGGFPDVAKVLDFGLVREISDSADPRLTAENVLHGTPEYLAPEAIRSADSIDARSDLYALGAVAYFLLTGTPVFSGRGALELIHHHLQTEPEPLSRRLGKPVPPKLEALVLSCLAKDPDGRPESARALAEALRACDDVTPWDEL
ncbi:MAG: serine/threonine-protein kinase, partial [Acidobacteriota bacterium]